MATIISPVDPLLLVFLLCLWPAVVAECPDKCSCSPLIAPTAVDCALLKFEYFPENIPKTVRTLDLSENWIETLPPTLANYPNLRRLNLSGNRLGFIPNTTFYGLTHLIHLDLSKNKISNFSDINGHSFLASNENLQTLNLSYNFIRKFDSSDSFSSMSLQVLDISSCLINYLEMNTLFWLPNLTHLNVSRNPIKWLTEGNPLTSSSLLYLDLSNCHLDSMRRNALEDLPNLQTLIVSRNKQLNLDSIRVYSQSLIVFEAEYCQFKIPTLSDFPNLILANLRGNNIESLRTKAFVKNLKLQKLDLSENHLSNIQKDAFLGLNDIKSMNLAKNDIAEITWDMFLTNFELRHLNLSNNALETFPHNFSVPHLVTLIVSMCYIHTIDRQSLVRLPYLKELDLSHNLIKSIPNNIESNTLEYLDVSSGHLSSINNETFAKFPALKYLNLKGNRFTNVPKVYMFSSNTLLESIQLSDNPWICDCKDTDFIAFWKYLTHVPPKIEPRDRTEMKCTSPEKFFGRSWESACFEELYPNQTSLGFLNHYGIYLVIIAMAIVFILLAALTVRRRMIKRDKVMRTNQEVRRLHQIRDTHERNIQVRQQIASTVAFIEAGGLVDEDRREREASQPPTYEEAVLMPRREVSSQEQLDGVRISADVSASGEVGDVTSLAEAAGSSGAPDPRPGHQPPTKMNIQKTVEDDDHDYDDVTDDNDDDDNESSPEELNAEEVQLMQQLRIRMWSRENINQVGDSQ